MPLGFYIGLGMTVVLLGVWLTFLIVQHRVTRNSTEQPLAESDREAVLNSVALHETATAGQMAAMSSARRQ
ncbi:hypothetical protein [Protaetiibacter intestinalis]|uniref:Uncharacterized protein n=1 Tax=Protaetiibacter intestinalis TaxID=2419774 RepID=A0A387B9X4_9MICO|nr:hypothetical protein [Protaetiibacter intestinalis]AYF99187.1 hypothetical protein D7I47_13600 [Protaetiibacter intestinalis]